MFFLGAPSLDTNSTTAFYASALARTMVAHIRGKIKIPVKVELKKIPHWLILDYLAKFDRYNYPPFFWKLREWARAYWYVKRPDKMLRM